jgi:hypothetical protein
MSKETEGCPSCSLASKENYREHQSLAERLFDMLPLMVFDIHEGRRTLCCEDSRSEDGHCSNAACELGPLMRELMEMKLKSGWWYFEGKWCRPQTSDSDEGIVT